MRSMSREEVGRAYDIEKQDENVPEADMVEEELVAGASCEDDAKSSESLCMCLRFWASGPRLLV